MSTAKPLEHLKVAPLAYHAHQLRVSILHCNVSSGFYAQDEKVDTLGVSRPVLSVRRSSIE